jgi:hypothetical protein
MFCGYYLSAATMVADEHSPAVPELTRRITLTSSSHHLAAALAGVLARMPGQGVTLGDILADSGYSHRVPATWATPLRAAGAQLVPGLHPNDRGPRGQPDRPRLEPAHGHDPAHAVPGLPDRRAQPAHPGRLHRTPKRRRAPRRCGPAAENPHQAPPRTRRRRALTAIAGTASPAPRQQPTHATTASPASPASRLTDPHAVHRRHPSAATHPGTA